MAAWVIVVDDDPTNLQVAGRILSRNNMRVTALRAGKSLVDYVGENGAPDLILLDINMPGMDGFETLGHLRRFEKEQGMEETPVIFLTADDDTETETHGFEAGGSDYIRKPFNPDILLKRINNIVAKQDRIISLKTEAATDKLTGFLNKAAGIEELSRLCLSRTGCLMMIDLDSFKLVNDIYGHEAGDKVLAGFADIVNDSVPAGSSCARLGGDEFAVFACGITSESNVASFTERLNRDILEGAKK